MLKGLFITALVILGGVLAVLALVLLLVRWSRRKERITWGLALLVLVAMTGRSIVYLTKKTVEKSIQTTVAVHEGMLESMEKSLEDDRSHLKQSPSAHYEQLKAWEPDSLTEPFPSGFYTYFGFRDFYRAPLVYPYALHSIDEPDLATVVSEQFVDDVRTGSEYANTICYEQLDSIAVDRQLVLGHLHKPHNDAAFVLLQLGDNSVQRFATREAMLEAAAAKGYSGSEALLSIRAYTAQF